MKNPQQRVTGLGGIFFKAKNTKKLQAWYKKHLGLPLDPAWGGCAFDWRDAKNPKKKGRRPGACSRLSRIISDPAGKPS